jgi:hypothetical protein
MIMRTMLSGLLALAVLAGAASQASAAQDCKVTGWTDGSWSRPIFSCPNA